MKGWSQAMFPVRCSTEDKLLSVSGGRFQKEILCIPTGSRLHGVGLKALKHPLFYLQFATAIFCALLIGNYTLTDPRLKPHDWLNENLPNSRFKIIIKTVKAVKSHQHNCFHATHYALISTAASALIHGVAR